MLNISLKFFNFGIKHTSVKLELTVLILANP